LLCAASADRPGALRLAQDEDKTPIKQDTKKGKLRFYPYNINWNYGMLPQTWEDPAHRAEDLDGVAVRIAKASQPSPLDTCSGYLLWDLSAKRSVMRDCYYESRSASCR
jgi:inorganic pyrophosphatase